MVNENVLQARLFEGHMLHSLENNRKKIPGWSPALVATMSHRTVFHAGEIYVRGPVSVSFPVIGRGALVLFLSRGKRNRRLPIMLCCAERRRDLKTF